MSLESNMMVAAEACFEMDPSPIHEAWLEKLSTEYKEEQTKQHEHKSHS